MNAQNHWHWHILKANSPFHCLRLLYKRHLHICKLISLKDLLTYIFSSSRKKAVSEQKWLYFFEQIHAQLLIGKTLLNALKSLPIKHFEEAQQRFVNQAIERLSNGYYLYPLLNDPQLNLTQQQIRLLQCAEVGGYFSQGLERLKNMIELQNKIRKQMKQSLIYPTCVLSLAFIFYCIMSLFLIPKFESFFVEQNFEMNRFLQILLSLNHQAPFFILSTILFIIFFTLFLKIKKLSLITYIERFFERGYIQFKYSLFAMDLAELLDNKIPLLESLKLASHVLPKKFSFHKISLALNNGATLSEAMPDLPEDFRNTLRSGEVSSQLTQTLRELSKSYYKIYENKLLQWAKWVEPGSLIAIAFFIFISIICLFYPLLQIFQSLDLNV